MQESWRERDRSSFPDVTLPYRIRPATPDDAPTVAAIGARLFTEAYGPTHPEPHLTPYLEKSFSLARTVEALEDPRVTVLLIERDDGAAIGYAHTVTRPTEFPLEGGTWPVTEIERFYVDAAWHGRGVADALMSACVAVAEERGAVRLFLQVWQEAPRPIAFYRRSGFAIDGETTFQFGPRTDRDFVMVRVLRALAASPGEAH